MKKFIKLSLILSFSFFLLMCASCATRKKNTEKERIIYKRDTVNVRDSIFTAKEKIVYLPSVNTNVIPNPCNETGKMNPINENIKFPFGNVNISPDEKGNLKVQINTDSINSVYELQYRERNEKQLHELSELRKELSKETVIPFNFWKLFTWISVVINCLLLFIILLKTKLKL